MKNDPLISIHVLTYNSADTIKQTLDSILNQQVNCKFEIVISDDASSDETPNILEAYKNKYPEIINLCLNKENKGIVSNYFETLDRCVGKYYFDLAGDDYLNRTTALQDMVDEMEKNKSLGFIEFEYDEFNEDKNLVVKNSNRDNRGLSKQAMLQKAFNGLILPAGWCMNTQLVKDLTDKEEYLSNGIGVEDYPIAVELLQNSEFNHSVKSVMTYRIRGGSASNRYNCNEQIQFSKDQLEMSRYFWNKYDMEEDWWKQREVLYLISKLNIAIRFYAKDVISETIKELKDRKQTLSFKMKFKIFFVSYPKIYNLLHSSFKRLHSYGIR